MITWGYYGQKAVEYLVGRKGVLPYRFVYIALIFIAPILKLTYIIDLADMFLLSMAFPNILGMLLLSKKVSSMLKEYTYRLESGQMPKYK